METYEGVRDTGPLEEGGSVVEDEVDTSELLHSLDPVRWKGGEGERRSAKARSASKSSFVREQKLENAHDTGPSPQSVSSLSSSEAVGVAGLPESHLSLESLEDRTKEGVSDEVSSSEWERDEEKRRFAHHRDIQALLIHCD